MIMWHDDYTMTRDPETGLMIVRFKGEKIGSSQTETAARIIRRKHHERRTA